MKGYSLNICWLLGSISFGSDFSYLFKFGTGLHLTNYFYFILLKLLMITYVMFFMNYYCIELGTLTQSFFLRHWRTHNMALNLLGCLVRPDVVFPAAGVRAFTSNLIHDNIRIREVRQLCNLLRHLWETVGKWLLKYFNCNVTISCHFNNAFWLTLS